MTNLWCHSHVTPVMDSRLNHWPLNCVLIRSQKICVAPQFYVATELTLPTVKKTCHCHYKQTNYSAKTNKKCHYRWINDIYSPSRYSRTWMHIKDKNAAWADKKVCYRQTISIAEVIRWIQLCMFLWYYNHILCTNTIFSIAAMLLLIVKCLFFMTLVASYIHQQNQLP